MIRPKRLLILLFVFNSIVFTSCSQQEDQPFYSEIQAFKQQDRDSFPPKNAILFVGSSSFRMWEDLQADFPGFRVINRGFGGSGLNDVIRYADEIILPYKPKQVVIYCGENDIAGSSITSADLLQRFMELFHLIRDRLPKAHIVFVSIKPSPSRMKHMPVMKDANAMIRKFLSGYPNTDYVDVYSAMLGKDGKPRPELFLEDELHMNEKGYEIWKAAITPYLIR